MNDKWIKILIGIVLVVDVCFIIYHYIHADDNKVQYSSQTQIETDTSEVQKLAELSNVPIDEKQAKEIQTQIIEVQKEVPVVQTETIIKEVPKVVEVEREKSNSDFSIVTDKNKPDEKFDLNNYKPDDKVVLNQYNIKAYKDVLNTISYAPANKEFGYSVQKKITKDGKYIGVGLEHSIDDKTTYAKIFFTF